MKALVKDPAARYQSAAEFLRMLETHAAESTAGVSTSMSRAATTPMPAPAVPSPRPGTGRPDSSTDWITPKVIEETAKLLAEYIGPIAHILVERTAARCASVDELYAALALEIESPNDRTKFLSSRPKKLR